IMAETLERKAPVGSTPPRALAAVIKGLPTPTITPTTTSTSRATAIRTATLPLSPIPIPTPTSTPDLHRRSELLQHRALGLASHRARSVEEFRTSDRFASFAVPTGIKTNQIGG